jgi:hypothetical protein
MSHATLEWLAQSSAWIEQQRMLLFAIVSLLTSALAALRAWRLLRPEPFAIGDSEAFTTSVAMPVPVLVRPRLSNESIDISELAEIVDLADVTAFESPTVEMAGSPFDIPTGVYPNEFGLAILEEKREFHRRPTAPAHDRSRATHPRTIPRAS